MDIISQCLSLTPVPYLKTAFDIFRFIVVTIEQVQACRQQLRVLSISIAELLNTLDKERDGRLSTAGGSAEPLEVLQKLLDEISAFIRKRASLNFLKMLYKKDDTISQIEVYHRRIGTLVNTFQIVALLSIQEWQSRNDRARLEDQNNLYNHLRELESNQNQLAGALDAHENNVMGIMVSLHRHLAQRSLDEPERRFFSTSLRYLSTSSGRQVQVESWMVTSYDVEFGPQIGAGGFGKVYKGTWQKLEVALKVMKTDSGIVPSSESIKDEIYTWSKIRHPHVLQFLGANVLDDKPFIVMPYMKNGNVRQYLKLHPTYDRLKLLHQVSLGIVYLHSLNVVHGDIKALNVLIDDTGNAVLCDFGLSRVRNDITTRTARAGFTGVTGSRNWMAPERLIGGSLRKPADIYSFAMLMFEIYANETPLIDMDYLDFVELVVRQNVRPERPEDEDAPGLSDEIWALAEACWVKDPRKRPIASALCDALSDVRSTPSDVTNDPSLGSPKYPDHRLVQTGDEVVLPERRNMSVPVRLPPVQKHIARHIAMDRHDEDDHLIKSPPIANMVGVHYRVGRKIGEGKVGVIYEGTNTLNSQAVAIKFEPTNAKVPKLQYEYHSYQKLAGCPGIPLVYHYAQEGLHNFLVMDLLGPSLEKLFNMCGRKFSIKTVCMAARQMLSRVQSIHERDLIYRDIKPDDFLVGCKETDTIHIVDFGMAKYYCDHTTKQHIPYRERTALSETRNARYLSINGHLGREPSRRDDLEALGYVFMYFLRGSLPWQGLEGLTGKEVYDRIREKKQSIQISELCNGFPEEIAVYLRYVQVLEFDETPDYDFLRELFGRVLKKVLKMNNDIDDGVFEWSVLIGSSSS